MMTDEEKKQRKRYDETCRKIFTKVSLLTRILQRSIIEYKGMSVEEIAKCILDVEFGNSGDETEHKSEIAGADPNIKDSVHGNIEYDLKFYVKDPTTGKKMIILMDFQHKNPSGYFLPNRMIYYAATAVSSQKSVDFEKTNYDDIKKVYSFWFVQKHPDVSENTVGAVVLDTKILNNGKKFFPAKVFDKVEIIVAVLGDYETAEKGSEVRLIDITFSGKLSLDKKEKMILEEYGIEDFFDKGCEDVMCNWSEWAFEGAEQRGMEKGMEKGRIEGMRTVINAIKKTIPDITEDRLLKMLDMSKERYAEIMSFASSKEA